MSTASSEKNSIPIRKIAGLFVLLFLGVVIALFDHIKEDGATAVGNTAPDFQARNLQGNWDGLAGYRGQVVILNLWATWCGPCREEMPMFEELYRRYRSEGLTILAVSLDKNADHRVKRFVEQYHLSFPVLLDTDGTVERLYPTFSIPTTFVIDRAGLIVARVDGSKNWSSDETLKAVDYLIKGAVPG
jgi:peroxiredoxin